MFTFFWAALHARLTDDWRRAWKWGSMRIAALGAAIYGAFIAWPGLALEVWNMIPQSVREYLPDNMNRVGAFVVCLGVIVTRLHKKPEKPNG
jgi:hypothetical protein